MATTYTDIDVGSIDAAATYEEVGCVTLIETITSNIQKVATGTYEADTALDPTLYTPGTVYYLKVTYTPSGDTQRSQVFPFLYSPALKASSAAAVTTTDKRHGKHLEAPVLLLRLGRGGFREADFENATEADRDRYVVELPIPPNNQAQETHLHISSGRAGAPLSIEELQGWGQVLDDMGAGGVIGTKPGHGRREVEVTVGDLGFRGSAYRGALLRRSRNLAIHGDMILSRGGYTVRRTVSALVGAACYLERVNADTSAAAFKACLFAKQDFYTDAATPALLSGDGYTQISVDPYGSAGNPIPNWIHMLGRSVWVLSTSPDFRVIVVDSGGTLRAKPFIPDPGNPTLSAVAGTETLDEGIWYVRVRQRDTDTDTRSGPNSRTTTTVSQVIAAGETLRVQSSGWATRCDKYQIELAKSDTPGDYEVVTEVYDAASAGSQVADSDGWISTGETDVYVRANPDAGTRFEFRSVRGVSVYRHSVPPADVGHVCQYNNRAMYSSRTGTYLVFSEPGNPEHFYTDPTDPHAGFNTFRGEGLNDSNISPCRALVATEDYVLYFMDRGVTIFDGSFVLVTNPDDSATYAGRDAHSRQVAENTLGSITGSTQVVDQEVYFLSAEGPAIFYGGGTTTLDNEAIRAVWRNRDPIYDGRAKIGYDPDTDTVLFGFVSKDANVAGVPDTILPWSRGKRKWGAPWTFDHTSMTLHRDQDDSGNEKGPRLFLGGVYASLLEFGVGFGDGEDGSDADAADLNSTSDTTTSVTVSGKSWTTNEWREAGACLTDRTTGRRYYKRIKSNTGDTVTWEGAITDAGGGWRLNLGGYPSEYHLSIRSPKGKFILQKLRALLFDLLGVFS